MKKGARLSRGKTARGSLGWARARSRPLQVSQDVSSSPCQAGPDSYLHSSLTVPQACEVTHTDTKGMSPMYMRVWPPSGAT